MGRRSAKESINKALVRLTGHHLVHGEPGSLPPDAARRIERLRARAENAESRVEKLRAERQRLQQELKEMREGTKRRDSFQPVWPLEPREKTSSLQS